MPKYPSEDARSHCEIFWLIDTVAPYANLRAAVDEAARLSRCELSSSAGPGPYIVVFVAVSRTIDSHIILVVADVTAIKCTLRAFVSTALQRDGRMSVTAWLPTYGRKRAWVV